MFDPAEKIVLGNPCHVNKHCAFSLALFGLVHALGPSFYPHVLAEMYISPVLITRILQHSAKY